MLVLHTPSRGTMKQIREYTQIKYQKRGKTPAKTYCPKCDGPIRLTNPRYRSWIECSACGAELEVLSTRPLKVALPVYPKEDGGRDYGRKGIGRAVRPPRQAVRVGKEGNMPQARCPNCDAIVDIERAREGMPLICPQCAAELILVDGDVFELDFATEWQ